MERIYNENIKAIKQHYPKLLDKLENIQDDGTIIEDMSVDGEVIYAVKGGRHNLYFNSRYNSDKASDEWVQQYDDINSSAAFIIMGMSNGDYIEKILNELDESNYIFIYEPSIQLFAKLIEKKDISKIISDNRVTLALGEVNNERYMSFLTGKIDYSNMSHIKYCALPNYDKAYSDEWKEMMRLLKDRVNNIVMNRNTEIALKSELINNIYVNSRDMYEQYTVNQLKEALEDIDKDMCPAIIVSAGPSLDKNIQELKKAKNKAFIIAVDTALNSLAKAGIEPDIAITVDTHKPVSLFLEEQSINIPMIVCQYSNAEVMAMLSGKRFYMGEMNYFTGLYVKYGEEMPAMIETGGSVANNAFSVAQYLGFTKIILVGQDLAYTDNKSHTDKAYGANLNSVNIAEKEKLMVDAVGGGKVLTSYVLNAYNGWFEQQILKYPELKVINATEGGAVKRGACEMTLSDAIEKECKGNIDFKKLIDGIPQLFSEEQQGMIMEEIKHMDMLIDEYISKVKSGIRGYDRLYELYVKGKANSREYNRVLSDLEKVNYMCDNDPVMQMAEIYNAKDNYEAQGEVHNTEKNERKELERVKNIGIKMLNSYVDALNEIKRDVKKVQKNFEQLLYEKCSLILLQEDELSYYAGNDEKEQQIRRAKGINEAYVSRIIEVNREYFAELFGKDISRELEEKDIYSKIVNQLLSVKLVKATDWESENNDIIEGFQEELIRKINKTPENTKMDEVYANNGQVYINGTQNINDIYINSLKLVEENVTDDKTVVIKGIGNGNILRAFLLTGKKNKIYVYEDNLDNIRHVIKYIQLKYIYLYNKLEIVLDTEYKEFNSMDKDEYIVIDNSQSY